MQHKAALLFVLAMGMLTVGCGGADDGRSPPPAADPIPSGSLGGDAGGQTDPASVDDDTAAVNAESDGGAPVCPIPDYGCGCSDKDAPVACQIIIHRAHNVVDCYHGHRRCVEGRWSQCSQAAVTGH